MNQLIRKAPTYSALESELKTIKFEGVEKYIFNKLTSAKFRGSVLPEELKQKIIGKIKNSVKTGQPIHVSVPFGGYKKWQLPTYPEPDWSEIFNLVQLRDYLTPISKSYKPGVILEYFSDEIFVSKMDNYPQKDLDTYNSRFSGLITWFSSYLPVGMSIKFSKIRDQISQDEIFKRFDKSLVILKNKWPTLPKSEQDRRIAKAKRNYKGEGDYATYLNSTLIHDAFIFGDWDEGIPWAFAEDMIPVGFRYTGAWGIHLKSSRSSTVQFWIGMGVLRQDQDTFIPSILTYNQYLELEPKIKYEKVDIRLSNFKNFTQIPIV